MLTARYDDDDDDLHTVKWFQVYKMIKCFYLTHRLNPNRCYYPGSESTRAMREYSRFTKASRFEVHHNDAV